MKITRFSSPSINAWTMEIIELLPIEFELIASELTIESDWRERLEFVEDGEFMFVAFSDTLLTIAITSKTDIRSAISLSFE